jgi:branched-subunit amino acid ABC-type transport system permease component
MDIGNLITLIVIHTFTLFCVQRTERKRRWIVALVAIGLIGLLTYRWGVYRSELNTVLIAAGIALVLNITFWLVWGRHHPPGGEGEIKVLGMED